MRFVILAQRRTGSNHLVALLRSHVDLICFGEIFNRNFNFKKHWSEMNNLWHKHHERDKNAKEFLLAGEKTIPKESSAWGFKLMPNHVSEDTLATILAKKVDRIIFLNRENLLARYSSDLIAKKTGQGVAGRNAEIKMEKVKFRSKEFNDFCNKIYSNEEKILRILDKIKTPILNIAYGDLSDPKTHCNLCNLLEVKNIPLISGHKKRNNVSVANRFKNVEFLRSYILNNGLNRWILETKYNDQENRIEK